MKKLLVLLLVAGILMLTGCSNEAEVPEITATPEATVEPIATPEVTAETKVLSGEIVELLDDGIAVIKLGDEEVEVTLVGDVPFSVGQVVELNYNELTGKYSVKVEDVEENTDSDLETDVEEEDELTVEPTAKPTAIPTTKPTVVPTTVPTDVHTSKPTVVPTVAPTAVPTAVPTVAPTAVPTAVPTAEPTTKPEACPGGVDPSIPCGNLLPGYEPWNQGADVWFEGDDSSRSQCNAWGQEQLRNADETNSNVISYGCHQIHNNGHETWGSAGILNYMN